MYLENNKRQVIKKKEDNTMTFVIVTIEARKDERELNRTKEGNNGTPTIKEERPYNERTWQKVEIKALQKAFIFQEKKNENTLTH